MSLDTIVQILTVVATCGTCWRYGRTGRVKGRDSGT